VGGGVVRGACDPLELRFHGAVRGRVPRDERGLAHAGAQPADEQGQCKPDDHDTHNKLHQRGAGLPAMPQLAAYHQWTALRRPYMGRITDTATKPTAPPTAMIRDGSMSAIMLRTL